jgi:hypothetical protein
MLREEIKTKRGPEDRHCGIEIHKKISRASIPDRMHPYTLNCSALRNAHEGVAVQTLSVFDSTINRANSPRQGNAILG